MCSSWGEKKVIFRCYFISTAWKIRDGCGMRSFNLSTVKLRDYGKVNSHFIKLTISQIVLPFQSCNRELNVP